MIKKRLSILCLAIMACMLFISDSNADHVNIVDVFGKKRSIERIPQRVVCLVPSITEMICEIGACDSLKGMTYHSLARYGNSQSLNMGGFYSPSIEKIKSVDPDLIFVADIHTQVIAQFANTNCVLISLKTESIQDSYDQITLLGKIFDKQIRANQIIDQNRKALDLISQKLSKVPLTKRKRVLRIMGRDKLMTPGTDSFQNEMIKAAGGVSHDFDRTGDVIDIDPNEWRKFDPQVIYGCGGDRKTIQALLDQPEYNSAEAVKNNRILLYPCDLTCRASTHVGEFVSWLAADIYKESFAQKKNLVFRQAVFSTRHVDIDLPYIKSAQIANSHILDFINKTLILDFKKPMHIVSTLEGQRSDILTVGNHFSPPQYWAVAHEKGLEGQIESLFKVIHKSPQTSSFLFTGADMEHLSIRHLTYKDLKVYALVTAGIRSNAMRMSKDQGYFYKPGTINMIIMSNRRLTARAMTRTIITATEAKTAALLDMDIRSSFENGSYRATGTGTDNMIVVEGTGPQLDNSGGHTKLGELVAKAVHLAVKDAIKKQNHIMAQRDLFSRLKERHISVYNLLGKEVCDCGMEKNQFVEQVESILLDPRYAGFIEMALSLSDDYDKGLIKDLSSFKTWADTTAAEIAGHQIKNFKSFVVDKDIPYVLQIALNSIFNGVYYVTAQQNDSPADDKSQSDAFPQRVVSLGPVITKNIYLLGAQDRLIADTLYCVDPPQARQKEKIGSVIFADIEKIISLNPDLVIGSSFTKQSQIEILEKFNIPVIKFENPKNFEEICQMTLKIGHILGYVKRAHAVVNEARQMVEALRIKTIGLPRKKIFFQIGLRPLHTPNKQTFVNEFITLSGGENIASDERSGIYGVEKVLANDPDVILIATMGSSQSACDMEKEKWMKFSAVKAVKNHQVFTLDPNIVCSPTPLTFVNALRQIAAKIHPEIRL